MIQQLEKFWMERILDSKELETYANFEKSLKIRYTDTQKTLFEQKWVRLLQDVRDNLDKDPESELGILLGKQFSSLVNDLYGEKYAALHTAIWEKGYKCQITKMDVDHPLDPRIISFLDRATAFHQSQPLPK